MGKAKKNRATSSRHNPTGSINVKSEEDTELNGTDSSRLSQRETLLQTVTEQLQSQDDDRKVCGLHLLAEVFDGQMLDKVAQDKIVRIVGPLLVDPNSSVRNSAAGALRNLSVNGGPEFCNVLVEQDIMTPLCILLHKFEDSWQPSSDSEDNIDTFLQAVNLLWNLCESSGTALKYFNQSSLLKLLVQCLDVKTFGMDIAHAVAECLHTVTEDNQEVMTQMKEVEVQLRNILSANGDDEKITYLKVLIAGIMLNMSHGRVSALDPSILTLIMAAVSSALNYDHRRALNQLTSQLELTIIAQQKKSKKVKEEESSDEEEMEDDAEKKPPQKATSKRGENENPEGLAKKLEEDLKLIKSASRLLEAQKVALEILANLCSGEDDDDDMNDYESDSEEMSDSSVADDSGTQEKMPLDISSDVLEALVSLRLVTKVWDKTILPAENVCDIIHEHPDCDQIVNRLNALRSRAFLCLQNIVSVMDLEELGGCNDLYNMWLETGKLVFNKTKANDIPLLEAATSVMRAAVQRLAEAKASQFSTLSVNDLQMFIQGEQQCEDPNVRANLIRIIGSIGQLLATSNSPLLPVIGKFLLDSASRDAELWVTAEALDCIFDVFGEDDTDNAAQEIDLVNKLRILVPQVKSKVRMQKKFLGDHAHIVMTANTNLNRFIKYKGKRLAVLTSNGNH